MPSSAASVSLSSAQRALQRMAPQRSTRSARPTTIPACGPPSSLSPEKQTRSAPAARRLPRGRLRRRASRERARAEVVDERQAVPPRDGGELASRGLLGEADDAEVRLVDAQEQRRLRADRALVVGGARPVRRPDLDEPRARAREDVGDAEAVADLDQLAARDDDLAALGERGEREQHRGGVVVDDERRLGAGQPAQDRGHVILARAALAAREVVLEVRVAARRLGHARERRLGERRAAEVRVDDHAGRVQHAAAGSARGRRAARRAGARARSPGSAPARISSRARSSTLRAASTASGSSDAARELVHRRKSRSSMPKGYYRTFAWLLRCS